MSNAKKHDSGASEGAERFFRALNEQLLLGRRLRDLEELRAAVIEFRDRYNHHWIPEHLNYHTPAQARREGDVKLSV